MAKALQHLRTRVKGTNGEGPIGYRWFPVWIGIGLLLAILLLVSSISTYVMVSRKLLVDHLRSDLSSQVAMMDREVRQGAIQNTGQLAAMLQRTIEKSSGRIAWIQIQNGDGSTVIHGGSPVTPAFSNESVRAHLSNRQPLFKTVVTANGKTLVEAFPFRI